MKRVVMAMMACVLLSGCTYERAQELGLGGAWRDMMGPLATRLVENRMEQRELAMKMTLLDDESDERETLHVQMAALIQEEHAIMWRMDRQNAAMADAAAGLGVMANTLNQQQTDGRLRQLEGWRMQQQHQQRMQGPPPNPLYHRPPSWDRFQ